MLRRDFLPLLTLLAGITGGNSAAQPIRVLYPDTDGLAFYAKDVINVPYETNFTEPYLYTWCVQGNASQAQEPTRPPGGNGTAQVVLDFTEYDGEQCWFEIRPLPASQDAHGLRNNSIEFNFINATHRSGPVRSLTLSRLMKKYDFNSLAPKSTFGISSTTTPATTLPTSLSTSATTSTTSSPQTSSSAPSGLSTAAVAGIGAAAGIAGIVLATILGVLVMRWRKKKQGRTGYLSDKTGRDDEQIPRTVAVSGAHEMPAPNEERNHKYTIVPSLTPQEMDAQQTQRYEAQ